VDCHNGCGTYVKEQTTYDYEVEAEVLSPENLIPTKKTKGGGYYGGGGYREVQVDEDSEYELVVVLRKKEDLD
jgi:hypothetical protein